MTTEPHVKDLVRAPWGFGDLDLTVIAVSERGDRAHVTVAVPLDEVDGRVIGTMTVTYRSSDLAAA